MLMLCEPHLKPHPSTHAQIAAPASGSITRHVADSVFFCLTIIIHRRLRHSFILNATLELLVSTYSVRFDIQLSFIDIQHTHCPCHLFAAGPDNRDGALSDVLLGKDFYTLYVSK